MMFLSGIILCSDCVIKNSLVTRKTNEEMNKGELGIIKIE